MLRFCVSIEGWVRGLSPLVHACAFQGLAYNRFSTVSLRVRYDTRIFYIYRIFTRFINM